MRFVALLGRVVGSRPAESCCATGAGNKQDPMAIPLRLAAEGESVRIVALHGGHGTQDRLTGMGLCVGGRLEVICNRFDEKMVLGHAGTRFFLGGGMALKIEVVIERSNL